MTLFKLRRHPMSVFQEDNLSWKAKGIMVCMGIMANYRDLIEWESPEVVAALDELIDHGYLTIFVDESEKAGSDPALSTYKHKDS